MSIFYHTPKPFGIRQCCPHLSVQKTESRGITENAQGSKSTVKFESYARESTVAQSWVQETSGQVVGMKLICINTQNKRWRVKH